MTHVPGKPLFLLSFSYFLSHIRTTNQKKKETKGNKAFRDLLIGNHLLFLLSISSVCLSKKEPLYNINSSALQPNVQKKRNKRIQFCSFLYWPLLLLSFCPFLCRYRCAGVVQRLCWRTRAVDVEARTLYGAWRLLGVLRRKPRLLGFLPWLLFQTLGLLGLYLGLGFFKNRSRLCNWVWAM